MPILKHAINKMHTEKIRRPLFIPRILVFNSVIVQTGKTILQFNKNHYILKSHYINVPQKKGDQCMKTIYKTADCRKTSVKKALAGFAALLAASMFTVSTPAIAAAPRAASNYTGEILSGPGIAVAETKAGALQGYVHSGIYNYKGVAYAEAKRFEEPRPVTPWTGIKTAMNYAAVAPQFTDQENDIFPPHWYWPHWEPRNLRQSDDCQNLNIWTPGIRDRKKRPVMVWLHGGGFSAGSASVEDVYDGENLSRKGDIVVVSVNHRLNSLGFLDLSAYGEKFKNSGNAGMLDIVAALRWIRENIENFGGDPDNVTLFGQSGGGAKILTLMAMPAAQGLFHKAIEESGAIEHMGMTLPDQEITRRVAELTLKELGLTPADIEKLQSMPYVQLATAANKAYLKAGEEFGPDRMYIGLGWGPVVDGNILPDNPVGDKGFRPQAKEIPLLIGTVANEWMTIDQWRTMATSQTDNKNNWDKNEVQKRLQSRFGTNTGAILQEFRKAYPDKPDADALYVDSWLRTRAIKTANLKTDQQGAPVYSYVFTWETPVMGGFGMAYHCSELPFIFNNIALSGQATGATKEAYALADKMSQAWINFARNGNPNAKGLPQWPAYTRENGATMIFDNKPEVRFHHDEGLMRLLAPEYK